MFGPTSQSPQPQHQQQQNPSMQASAHGQQPSGGPSSSSSSMSAEQYHLMMLQYQLQQSQAHAQAQAQLLALYQQQQQQQQLQSAASAYHQALAQSTRSQAAAAYGLPHNVGGGAPQAQLPHMPNMLHHAGSMPPPPPGMPPHPYGALNLPGFANTNVPLAPAAAPTPNAVMTPAADPSSASSTANPTDARIHANLAGTAAVEWVPLPPRYVMDSVAKTAAAAKLAAQRKDAVEAGTIAEDDETTQPPVRPTKTVFVGGISYDVARDARVLPWLAASMCNNSKKPVVVRKVIPHKERKAKSDGAGASPKLALSAFVVVDGDDAEALVETLHHRVMWDIGGCWIAKTLEGVEALRDYANAQCTWQRREQGAASGLPRHMMTVEAATAMGTHDKPSSSAVNTKRSSAMTTTNFGNAGCIDLGATPAPAVGFDPTQAVLPMPPSESNANNALRFDWGVEPSATSASAIVADAPHDGAVITKSPSARSPSATTSNASSGNIGER